METDPNNNAVFLAPAKHKDPVASKPFAQPHEYVGVSMVL